MVFAGLFIAHIEQGGFYLQRLEYMPEVIDIIIAALLYFSAFSLLFTRLLSKRLLARQSRREEGGEPK